MGVKNDNFLVWQGLNLKNRVAHPNQEFLGVSAAGFCQQYQEYIISKKGY